MQWRLTVLIRSLACALRPTRAVVLMALEVAALSARAAPQVDTRPTLPQLILAAQRDNKELLAARYVVDIGRARLVQAGLLPNPRVNVSGASGIAFGDSAAYGVAVGITQDFPMTGRILRQQDVARVDVALAQAEVADAERRLAGEVASGVYRVLIVERQISTVDGLVTVDERLAKVTRSRYRAAEVSELDVNIVALDCASLLRAVRQRRPVHRCC